MPVIAVIVSGDWKTAVAHIGPFAFGWGLLLSDLIYLIIVALVVFIAAKRVLKMDKVAKM